ncbi:DUF6616 family protein [Pseudonocardia sp. Cha107L01]|uniref:DUF6616 family protein n=1 Tax=Pseudonocardia sp. Cha107L01 TaxID=3457576 RepID=UPI00403E3FF9
MQQVFVELYKYNDAWRATTPAERAGFVRNGSGSLSQLTRGGVEVIAFAVNDPGTDRRAPYDIFCVYLVPDRDAQREFARGAHGERGGPWPTWTKGTARSVAFLHRDAMSSYLLGALLDSLELGDEVVLVGHDWGANLAVDWAMKNSHRVSGIVFGEALMPPVRMV